MPAALLGVLLFSGSATAQSGQSPRGRSAGQVPLPAEAVARLQEGIAHYRQGRYLAAASAFERARDLAPNNAKVSEVLGKSLLLGNRYIPARAEFQRFLGLHPEALEPRLGLARIAVRFGEYEHATRWYREVLNRDPENAVALFNLGRLRYRAADYTEARDLTERMLLGDPDHPEAHYLLGMIFMQLEDPSGAEQEFLRALALDPEHSKAHFNLGRLYSRTGEVEKAAREQEIFLRLSDRMAADRAAEATARDYFLAGDFDAALREYDRLLAGSPHSGKFQLGRGMCLLKLGRQSEALRDLEKAASLDPRLADVFYHLAAVYEKMGLHQQSAKARRKYEALGPFGDGSSLY